MKDKPYFIGIDGGGTQCRARIESQKGELLGEGRSGPANIMRDCPLAISSINSAIEQAIVNSGQDVHHYQCHVGAGLAGANIALAASHFNAWQHPFANITLVSDLHAACLGAHRGNDGAVIIIGTGSTGTVYQDGLFSDLGGHGFPIGDCGSGAWLGLRAIQHTLLGLDKLGPFDALCENVLFALNVENAQQLVGKTAAFRTSDYAALVKVMVPLWQKGDAATSDIFSEGLYYIENMAKALIGNTDLPLTLIGGLSQIYGKNLSPDVQQHLVHYQSCPEQGAILFAKRAYAAKETSS